MAEVTFAFHPSTHLHSLIQREIFLVAVFYFPDATINKQFVTYPPSVVCVSKLNVPMGPLHLHVQASINARFGKIVKRTSRTPTTIQRYTPSNHRRPRTSPKPHAVSPTKSYVARNLSRSLMEEGHRMISPPRPENAQHHQRLHSPSQGSPSSPLEHEIDDALQTALHRNLQLISELESVNLKLDSELVQL